MTTKPILSGAPNLPSITIHPYERYLPTAFDESLSILQKINKVINQLNVIGEISNNITQQWNELMEWIVGNGLTEIVSAEIDKRIDDGTFDTLIYNIVGDLTLLETIDKTDMVNAINEVNTIATENNVEIGDISLLNTTNKDSLVDALNEMLVQVLINKQAPISIGESTGYGIVSGFKVRQQNVLAMAVEIGDNSTFNIIHMSTGVRYTRNSVALSINPSHQTLDRIDLIYVTENGVISYLEGVPSANPSPPNLTVGNVLLAEINVKSGDTTINDIDIIDKRTLKSLNDLLTFNKSNLIQAINEIFLSIKDVATRYATKNEMDDLKTSIEQSIDDIQNSLNATIDSLNVVINDELGNKDNLLTVDKTNIVNSINELVEKSATKIELETLDTQKSNDLSTLETQLSENINEILLSIDEINQDGTSDKNINGLYVNVKKFGAIGDDIANDSNAFINAITSANGKPILVPKGVYDVRSMPPVSGRVVLIGLDGAKIKGFKYTELNIPVINYQNPSNSGVTIPLFKASNIAFEGDLVNAGLHIITQAQPSVIQSYFIENCDFYGALGLITENCATSIITNCNFYHNKYSFQSKSCTNILIENCHFFSPYGVGLDIGTSSSDTFRTGGENIKLIGCTFIDGVTAIKCIEHNYLVLDSCLIDYFNCGIYFEGSRYGRIINTYIGHDGTNRSGASLYVTPVAFGAVYARGYENGATKKSCGFEATNTEFTSYNNTIHNTINLNGNGLTFPGIEEVNLQGCRFTANPDFAGPYHLIIQTAVDVSFNDCKFYAPLITSPNMIAPWVYTASSRISHENNQYINCFKSNGTVIKPASGNADTKIEMATVKMYCQATVQSMTNSAEYTYQNKFIDIPKVVATVRYSPTTSSGFLGNYQVNVSNIAQDITKVFVQGMMIDAGKFPADTTAYVEVDLIIIGKI